MYYNLKVIRRQYRKTPLLLRNLGLDHPQDPIDRPRGFPVWQILYGVSGSGTFALDGSRGLLQPGQIALLYPGEAHQYRSAVGDWTVHFLGFDGTLCREVLVTLGMTRSGLYRLSDPGRFLRHLDALEGLLRDQRPGCLSECSKELYALLLDLAGDITRLPDSRFAESVGLGREMILYLEDHYGEDISLDELGAQFGRTPEYLCAVFRQSTGETVMQYLRRIRIHHAQVLLLTAPDIRLREVAEKCGFHSLSYFCKVFRESTGFTPQSFRLGGREQRERENQAPRP